MASICSRASERFIDGSSRACGVYFALQSGESQEQSGVRQCFALPLLFLCCVSAKREARAAEQSTAALQTRPLPSPASICHHPGSMLKFAPYVLKSLWRHRSRALLTASGAAVALFVFAFLGAARQGLADMTRGAQAERVLIVFQQNRFCPSSSRLPEDYAASI